MSEPEVAAVVDDDAKESDDGLWSRVWLNNQGAILILFAEACASAMDAIARYLQQGEHGMHALQIIFARMSVTFILSFLYLWAKRLPNFPLGEPSVRPLLILRALFGFAGLFCIYYSVHYLPLAEATIFRFLVPLLTAFACSLFLHQAFTRKDILVSILALAGIIIIAHPASLMGRVSSHTGVNQNYLSPISTKSSHADTTTSMQRFIAVLVATVGVIGGASAFTTIRLIGKRAHALHTIIYYSFLCTVGSAFFLMVIPGISFTIPRGIEWVFLMLLGVLGFALQFLLTKGLQLDTSSKATTMMYSQVIYAILFDWLIWRVLPDRLALLGGGLVVGSTLWSALTKPNIHSHKDPDVREVTDEERPLLGNANNRESAR